MTNGFRSYGLVKQAGRRTLTVRKASLTPLGSGIPTQNLQGIDLQLRNRTPPQYTEFSRYCSPIGSTASPGAAWPALFVLAHPGCRSGRHRILRLVSVFQYIFQRTSVAPPRVAHPHESLIHCISSDLFSSELFGVCVCVCVCDHTAHKRQARIRT